MHAALLPSRSIARVGPVPQRPRRPPIPLVPPPRRLPPRRALVTASLPLITADVATAAGLFCTAVLVRPVFCSAFRRWPHPMHALAETVSLDAAVPATAAFVSEIDRAHDDLVTALSATFPAAAKLAVEPARDEYKASVWGLADPPLRLGLVSLMIVFILKALGFRAAVEAAALPRVVTLLSVGWLLLRLKVNELHVNRIYHGGSCIYIAGYCTPGLIPGPAPVGSEQRKIRIGI